MPKNGFCIWRICLETYLTNICLGNIFDKYYQESHVYILAKAKWFEAQRKWGLKVDIYQILTTFIKYLLHLSNIYFQIFSFIKYLLNRICCIIKYLSERQFYEMSAWHHLWWNILFEHMLWNMYSRNCFQMSDCLDNFILISCFRWPKERKFWSTNMQTTSKTRLWKLSQTNV